MPSPSRRRRLLLLLFHVTVLAIHLVSPTGFQTARAGPSPQTHSNFLRAVPWRGRFTRCGKDPAVCLERAKNPGGGEACCGGRVCVDVGSDPDHCGGCGRRCGFGLTCCEGACVDAGRDERHCGRCNCECESGACRFGMCDYGGPNS